MSMPGHLEEVRFFGNVELHHEYQPVFEELDCQRPDCETWERVESVASLHHNLDPIHGVILGLRFEGDDRQGAMVRISGVDRDVDIVDFGLPHARHAFADVRFEMERGHLQEVRDEVVVAQDTEQPLFVNRSEAPGQQSSHGQRRAILEFDDLSDLRVSNQRRFAKRERIHSPTGYLQNSEARFLNLRGQDGARFHPVDEIRHVSRLHSLKKQLFPHFLESEDDPGVSGSVLPAENREQDGAVNLAPEAMGLQRSRQQNASAEIAR